MKKARELIPAMIFLLMFALSPSPSVSGPLDAYLEGAHKEGAVTLGISLREKRFGKPAAGKYLRAFEQRYPFLKATLKRIGGVRERERVLSEMTAGMVRHDVVTISNWMAPTVMDANLARIEDWQKLGVPDFLVHPQNTGISLRTSVYGIAYNREIIPDEVAATFTWETCVDPRWKGKIAMEARPIFLTDLYQRDGWGREKTLDFAKRWAANKPILEASRSTATQKLAVGAFPMFCGMPRKQVKEFEVYGEVNSVGIVFPEPTPVGLGDLIYVPRQAKHPNAAIVFLAWSATQEAQNALDDVEFTGHPAFEGNEVSKILKGKKAVFGNWEYAGRAGEILAEILQALGIPVVQ